MRLFTVILVAVLLFINYDKGVKPPVVKDKVVHVGQVYDNESIECFLTDSIMRAPYRPPVIRTELAPLHPRILGLTTEIGDNVYLIQLNSQYGLRQLQRTLFHELVHVYQFERNMLETGPGLVWWEGNIYTWLIPWAYRPWEIHAEHLTDELYIAN